MKEKITQDQYDEFLNDAKDQLGLDITKELQEKFEVIPNENNS